MTNGVWIIIGKQEIYCDGVIPIPEENAVQCYVKKTGLECIPPIKVAENMLSDFGKQILSGKEKP